jgi:hypothetical protein
MICPTGKVEYFCGRDWTGKISLKGFGKFGFWRKPQVPLQARIKLPFETSKGY